MEDNGVDQRREFGIQGIFLEHDWITGGRSPVIAVLVGNSDKPFAEERIPLASNLHESPDVQVLFVVAQDGDGAAAGRGIDADGLEVSTELRKRNIQRNGVHIESALRIL